VGWLDFGCGAGGLLKYLRHIRTLTVNGREIVVQPVGHDVGSYVQRLKHSDGFEILDWEALSQLPGGRFDVITCIEVIEHVPNPSLVIDLLARNLKDGGLLILTTGSLTSHLAKLQGISFTYCIPEIHVSLLTPRLLCAPLPKRRPGVASPLLPRFNQVSIFEKSFSCSRRQISCFRRQFLRGNPSCGLVVWRFRYAVSL